VASEAPRTRPRALRRLVLEGPPASCGRAHGARFRDAIRRYTDERVRLATGGSWSGRPATREDVLGLAGSMLPAHARYAPDLCREMEALADAAGISAAEAIVVGGFTDFVDTLRGHGAGAPEEDDCTAVLTPDARSEGAGFLAQTWDMHDSATEHVLMLDVRAEHGPRALVFSTVGCLGQIGMNEAGIAVGINNLGAAAGRVGVTWPFVVRKVLQQETLEDALACVTGAELAGAHNYLLLDRHGRGFDVEAMPQGSHVEALRDRPLFHSNHCLHAATRRHEADRAAALVDSSQRRLERARELLADERAFTEEKLFAFTRDAEAICQRAAPPYHIESSGAVVMRPATGDLWAVWGLPSENEYEHFGVGSHG
jgi:isopenicillin-N N-acyltransferase-like protein